MASWFRLSIIPSWITAANLSQQMQPSLKLLLFCQNCYTRQYRPEKRTPNSICSWMTWIIVTGNFSVTPTTRPWETASWGKHLLHKRKRSEFRSLILKQMPDRCGSMLLMQYVRGWFKDSLKCLVFLHWLNWWVLCSVKDCSFMNSRYAVLGKGFCSCFYRRMNSIDTIKINKDSVLKRETSWKR